MVMKTGGKKLSEMVSSAVSMGCAEATLKRNEMSHMDILRDALNHECMCGGRAIPSWVRFSFG